MNITRRKIFIFLLLIMTLAMFSSCGSSDHSKSNTKTKSSYDYDVSSDYGDTDSAYKSNNYYNSDKKSSFIYNHYCQASGCLNKGTYEYKGIYGKSEYYCYKHYKEIIDTMDKFENDVGNADYSSHKCEECSNEGTHSIIGISGRTEYYCTKHYYEMKKTLRSIVDSVY